MILLYDSGALTEWCWKTGQAWVTTPFGTSWGFRVAHMLQFMGWLDTGKPKFKSVKFSIFCCIDHCNNISSFIFSDLFLFWSLLSQWDVETVSDLFLVFSNPNTSLSGIFFGFLQLTVLCSGIDREVLSEECSPARWYRAFGMDISIYSPLSPLLKVSNFLDFTQNYYIPQISNTLKPFMLNILSHFLI